MELLERWSVDGDISASSNKHTFSSLDDVKGNLALFAGELSVKMRFRAKDVGTYLITIELGNCATVRVSPIDELTEVKLEKMAKELSEYRTPILGYLPIVPMFCWALLFIFMIWTVPGSGQPMPSIFPWASEKTNLVLWFVTLGISILGFAASAFPQVYYNPRQTFWQRNKDKIALGVIMLLLGAFLTEVLRWLVEGMNK